MNNREWTQEDIELLKEWLLGGATDSTEQVKKQINKTTKTTE